MLLAGSHSVSPPTRERPSPCSAGSVEEQKAPADQGSALMRSSMIEGDHIGLEKSDELFLVKDQEVIQAFSSHTSQKAFTHSIREGACGTEFEGS